jgi:GNAT superfamily N-acetyltransferase
MDPVEAVKLLARVGLTDAFSWPRLPHELSEGQRHRYHLARLVAETEGIIVLDDWTAPLDRLTARALAWTTGRTLRAAGRSALIATTHHDVIDDLQPDILIQTSWEPAPAVDRRDTWRGHSTVLDGLSFRRGTLADYAPLAPLHYAAGPPQNPRSVYVADLDGLDTPAAVAVLTYPDLRNPARDLATDDRYRASTQRDVARRLNRELARLARIVVRPELRGLGCTRPLIGHIVEQETLRYIECSTAMGRYSPFLTALGFVEAPRPAHDIEAELLDWAERNRISADAVLDLDTFRQEIDALSVRQRRLGLRLIWHYYHKFVLHRRTRKPRPKQVPGPEDDRWIDALDFVGRRLYDRPSYFILGPLADSPKGTHP